MQEHAKCESKSFSGSPGISHFQQGMSNHAFSQWALSWCDLCTGKINEFHNGRVKDFQTFLTH